MHTTAGAFFLFSRAPSPFPPRTRARQEKRHRARERLSDARVSPAARAHRDGERRRKRKKRTHASVASPCPRCGDRAAAVDAEKRVGEGSAPKHTPNKKTHPPSPNPLPLSPPLQIRFLILFSRQGKVRLSKFYVTLPPKDRAALTRELVASVLARPPRACSVLEVNDFKVREEKREERGEREMEKKRGA